MIDVLSLAYLLPYFSCVSPLPDRLPEISAICNEISSICNPTRQNTLKIRREFLG